MKEKPLNKSDVIPANAGIQGLAKPLDSGIRRNDEKKHKTCFLLSFLFSLPFPFTL